MPCIITFDYQEHLYDKFSPLINILDIKDLKVVYVIYNEKDEVLYVGRTKDFYSRVISHFSEVNMTEWKKEAYRIEYYPLLYITDTYLLEIYLISILNPKYNIEFSDVKNENVSFSFNLPDKKILYVTDLKPLMHRSKIINSRKREKMRNMKFYGYI